MKKILIIYPHFPPSNLAGVHRSRLFAMHLPAFGWEPVILTVDEKYYEEAKDWALHKLLPATLRVEKVSAYGITSPRFIGDIGLRGFFQLYKKAKHMISTERFDFLYIPIPSFYCALLGRWLHESTGITYGIDYIDPWVHYFPGSRQLLSRHWFSTRLATILEPIAVKKASLITGVAKGYYTGVLNRNPHLKDVVVAGAMPYGGELSDHQNADGDRDKLLFRKTSGKLQIMYAGVLLPQSKELLAEVFKSIATNQQLFSDVMFHFIGTGNNEKRDTFIRKSAIENGIWQTNVFEYPDRIPYLEVLMHLNESDAVFILGSTEAHYTPSKTYQAILAKKPVIAILHEDSSAVKVIKEANAGIVFAIQKENAARKISNEFASFFTTFKLYVERFHAEQVRTDTIERYSAKEVTRELAMLLDEAVAKTKTNSKL